MSPKSKKPTKKETEKVINNIIHDLQIVNQKADSAVWGLRNYIEFIGQGEEFGEWLKKKGEEFKTIKEQNERDKPIETSDKTDNKQSSREESVGSVSKS